MSEFGAAVGMKAIDTAMAIGQNAVNTAIANAYYKRNLGLQVQAQKELFDYESEYNTPKNQMARLAEAGLNPNLVLGGSAPSGTGANVSAPSGASPSGGAFDSSEIAQIMAHISQAKNLEADINLKDATANWYNKQAGRYDELLDSMIARNYAENRKLQKELDLADADIRVKNAQMALYEAEEEYKRGEINLQTYDKYKIVAQTQLFKDQSKLTNYEADLTNTQAALEKLELKYKQLFLQGGEAGSGELKMKELSKAEYDAAKAEFDKAAKVAAADAQIHGSKVARWIDYVFTELNKVTGSGADVAAGAKNIKAVSKAAK